MISDDNFISVDPVKNAAEKIHEAGGCYATDKYSRGYDDAAATALNILLEETGYVTEDIPDYGEDKEAAIYE